MRRAALEGGAQAVAAWLYEGGGVDAGCAEHHDATLLMAAAGGGQEAVVRILLQRGASVNLQGSDGLTALMCAAYNGHTTIVQALLDAKADTSLQDDKYGWTALEMTKPFKRTATAQVLRQHVEWQAAEAEAKAGASAARAAAAADATAAKSAATAPVASAAGAKGGALKVISTLTRTL